MKHVFIALTIVALGGCSTIFHGSQQPVTFNSEPEGANVMIDGNLLGKTPTTVTLKKSKYKTAMIRKDGYETATVNLDTTYDALTLLNIFWDSSTTDLVTGNAYEYDPNAYNVVLVKKQGETSLKKE